MKVIPREASRITNSNIIRELRNSISLTDTQYNVLIGMLLGDGCLSPNSWKRHYRLQVVQSNKQKDYLFWKFQIFQNFTLAPPKFRKETDSWRFRTISHLEFTKMAKLFYPSNRKIVPKVIDKLLINPLSIAIWYQDDGALTSRKDSFILNSQNFTRKENIKLKECLRKNFSIKATLNRDKIYWRLYISKQSAHRFLSLIKKYVIASMRYKLPLDAP